MISLIDDLSKNSKLGESKQAASDRALPGRLQALLRAHPELETQYQRAREVVRVFRRASFYEVSQRCNLFCEGCYYFESSSNGPVEETIELQKWDDFFAGEARRSVSLGYFVGAEPALEQKRLRAAARHLDYGILGTNGTIRIDGDIPFRIQISIWTADVNHDTKLRGAPAFRKALANYSGDPRANLVFTLSAWNLHTARDVAVLCRDHGLPLTFNHYSPSHSFLNKLAAGKTNDNRYFRLSAHDDSPCFKVDDLLKAREVVGELMEEFPDTILYTPRLNEIATQTNQIHELDPTTGVAKHCGSKIVGRMSYFKADLTSRSVKCCTPDIDCKQCRMYSGLWSSRLLPAADDLADANTLRAWLDLVQMLGKVFLYKPDQAGTEDLLLRDCRLPLEAAE